MDILRKIKSKLIVSCQPVVGGPLDNESSILSIAEASIEGGAAGLRINDKKNVYNVKKKISVPVIGIKKRTIKNSKEEKKEKREGQSVEEGGQGERGESNEHDLPRNRHTPIKKQTETSHRLPTIRQHTEKEAINKKKARQLHKVPKHSSKFLLFLLLLLPLLNIQSHQEGPHRLQVLLKH